MRIKIDFSGLKQSGWREYAIRFLFGGIITCLAGIIAERYGPVVGGVFLAFPAIFPSSATLVEKHERDKKRAQHLSGDRRARQAASVDAAGAAMGSLGLVIFGLIVWRFLPGENLVLVLAGATVAWGLVSVSTWFARKRM